MVPWLISDTPAKLTGQVFPWGRGHGFRARNRLLLSEGSFSLNASLNCTCPSMRIVLSILSPELDLTHFQ